MQETETPVSGGGDVPRELLGGWVDFVGLGSLRALTGKLTADRQTASWAGLGAAAAPGPSSAGRAVSHSWDRIVQALGGWKVFGCFYRHY